MSSSKLFVELLNQFHQDVWEINKDLDEVINNFRFGLIESELKVLRTELALIIENYSDTQITNLWYLHSDIAGDRALLMDIKKVLAS